MARALFQIVSKQIHSSLTSLALKFPCLAGKQHLRVAVC